MMDNFFGGNFGGLLPLGGGLLTDDNDMLLRAGLAMLGGQNLTGLLPLLYQNDVPMFGALWPDMQFRPERLSPLMYAMRR